MNQTEAPDQEVAEEDKVEAPSVLYQQMLLKWDLLHDLRGGTTAMRQAESRWLPREAHETEGNYKARLNRTILFNGYSNAIEKLIAKPFAKPVVTLNTAPTDERLTAMLDDVDRSGQDLTQFGRALFDSCLTYGLTHILVDYPVVEKSATLADEKAIQARPVFIHVKPPQLIGWRTVVMPSGEIRLTMIRMYEKRVEDVGEYGDEEVEYIRVYTETTWELWRKAPSDKKYLLQSEGDHSFGAVPLVTIYFKRTGMMLGDPPLEDLAWLNLAHWQSWSDQRNILRFARIGILFAKGLSEEQVEQGFTIGPSQVIATTNTEADMKYVEHQGAAIKAGDDDLTKLEARMEMLGMQPLFQQVGNITATQKGIEESARLTWIQAWIRASETGMLQAFKIAAKWIGQEIPDDWEIEINDDFSLLDKATDDCDFLLKMCLANKLTDRTMMLEVKRRGLLGEDLDIDQELDDLATQGPPLGAVSLGPTGAISEKLTEPNPGEQKPSTKGGENVTAEE